MSKSQNYVRQQSRFWRGVGNGMAPKLKVQLENVALQPKPAWRLSVFTWELMDVHKGRAAFWISLHEDDLVSAGGSELVLEGHTVLEGGWGIWAEPAVAVFCKTPLRCCFWAVLGRLAYVFNGFSHKWSDMNMMDLLSRPASLRAVIAVALMECAVYLVANEFLQMSGINCVNCLGFKGVDVYQIGLSWFFSDSLTHVLNRLVADSSVLARKYLIAATGQSEPPVAYSRLSYDSWLDLLSPPWWFFWTVSWDNVMYSLPDSSVLKISELTLSCWWNSSPLVTKWYAKRYQTLKRRGTGASFCR